MLLLTLTDERERQQPPLTLHSQLLLDLISSFIYKESAASVHNR